MIAPSFTSLGCPKVLGHTQRQEKRVSRAQKGRFSNVTDAPSGIPCSKCAKFIHDIRSLDEWLGRFIHKEANVLRTFFLVRFQSLSLLLERLSYPVCPTFQVV